MGKSKVIPGGDRKNPHMQASKIRAQIPRLPARQVQQAAGTLKKGKKR